MLQDGEIRFLQGLIDAGVLTSLRPDTAPAPGADRFGRYEIVTKVGEGGAGSVYRARDLELNRTVALKVLDAVPTENTVQRFVREAQIMGRLRHENIVSVHELIQDRGRHAIVMEFVEGRTLADELGKRIRPLPELLRIVQKVAEGLEFVHKHGVVHRDVKPGNIIVDPQGHPRITDFGLAGITEADSKLTATGAWLGTPLYMSPEQAGGLTHDLDLRTDVYSLGVVLYEILTGQLPFTGVAAAEILHRIVSQEAVPPRSIDRKIPRDLEVICTKAMEKRPERRYQTAGELAADLDRYLKGEPIAARPPAPAVRLKRSLTRHKRTSVAASILLVAALIGAGFLMNGLREERRRAELLRVEDLGRSIVEWDGHLYERPEDVHFPALIERMKGLEKEIQAHLEADPTSADVHYHLGRAQRRLGKTLEAARHLDKAIRLRPDRGVFWLERGLLRLYAWNEEFVWTALALRLTGAGGPEQAASEEDERFTRARADLDAAVKAGLPPVYGDYARALTELGKAGPDDQDPILQKFADQWRKEVEFSRVKADLHYFAASILLARFGRPEKVVQLLGEALAVRRCFSEAYALRAFCLTPGLERPGELDEPAARAAERDAQWAIDLGPEYFGGYLSLGMVRSFADLARFRQASSRDERISKGGEALDRRGKVVGLMDRAVDLGPSLGATYFCRSRVLYNYGLIRERIPAARPGEIAAKELAEAALRDLDRAQKMSGKAGWSIEWAKSLIQVELARDIPAARRSLEEAIRLAREAGRWPIPLLQRAEERLKNEPR